MREMTRTGPGNKSAKVLPGNSMSWLIAIRACFISLALLAATVNTFIYQDGTVTDADFYFHYRPVAMWFGWCAVSALWLLSGRLFGALKISQLVSDVGLVTWMIYTTGGPVSPLLFLYLTLVMSISILFSRRTALFVTVLSSVAFLTLSRLMIQGVWRLTDGTILSGVSEGALLLQTIGLTSAMVLVTVATSFLMSRLSATYQLVEQSRRDLASMHLRQHALIDGIPEGIVLTDKEGKVTFLNQRARELLNTSDAGMMGQLFLDALRSVGIDIGDVELVTGSNFECTVGSGEATRKIAFHSRASFDEKGADNGRVYICRDVTHIRTIEGQLEMQERLARLMAETDTLPGLRYTKVNDFVGESPIMQRIFKLIERTAPSDATVLINGESGTGKELVAKALHLGGLKADGPFVPVNCGAIPENLIESELFGHKKGAFTGADSDNLGLFRRAQGGTIFLDEIGDLPLLMQVKLLRALQEKKVRPVGANNDIPIDVRVIAATNRNLRGEVSAGRFREDLFYRLNVINIQLPPLRERKEDIPLIITSSLKRLTKGKQIPVVPPATMQLLLSYTYPGNVRELENILERSVVLGGDVILPEHLPDLVRETPVTERAETKIIVDETLVLPVDLDRILADVERKYIEVALVQTSGVKKKAAELLGINFRSFRYRLEKLSMVDEVSSES